MCPTTQASKSSKAIKASWQLSPYLSEINELTSKTGKIDIDLLTIIGTETSKLIAIHSKSIPLAFEATFRSYYQKCSIKKSTFKNVLGSLFSFTGKHHVSGLQLYWKRDSGTFPVNFAKLLRTLFLQITSGRLLLHFWIDNMSYLTLVRKLTWTTKWTSMNSIQFKNLSH